MSRYPKGFEKVWNITLSPEHRDVLGRLRRAGLNVQVHVNNDAAQPLGEHLVVTLVNGEELVTTQVGYEMEQLFEEVCKSAPAGLAF